MSFISLPRSAPFGNQNALGNRGNPNARGGPIPGAGAEPKYNKAFVNVVKRVAHDGASDFEIAQLLDVTLQTLRNWRMAYPDFREAFKLGKEGPNERAKRSLLDIATGYSYPAEKAFFDGKSGQVVVHHYIEHVPPNPTAATKFLAARDPEWVEKTKTEVSGPDGSPIQVENVPARELVASGIAGIRKRRESSGNP